MYEKLRKIGGPEDFAYDALVVSASIAAGVYAIRFVAVKLNDNEEMKNTLAKGVANTIVGTVSGATKVVNVIRAITTQLGNGDTFLPDSTMHIGPEDI